jgi:hypothetical protein
MADVDEFEDVASRCIKGHEGLENLLLFPKDLSNRRAGLLLFFPGDIQNLHAIMSQSARQYLAWSLERTQQHLMERFPSWVVITIRPAKFEAFQSLYVNFLRPGGSILHLMAIVKNFILSIENPQVDFGSLPIILSGFSKGVIVLNYFLAELSSLLHYSKYESADHPMYMLDWELPGNFTIPETEYHQEIFTSRADMRPLLPSLPSILDFFSRIREIHYVDGHRFPTEPSICSEFAKYVLLRNEKNEVELSSNHSLHVYLHGSPRQINDSSREWISQEFSTFERNLQTFCGQEKFTLYFSFRKYFWKERKSLAKHFETILCFYSPSSTH